MYGKHHCARFLCFHLCDALTFELLPYSTTCRWAAPAIKRQMGIQKCSYHQYQAFILGCDQVTRTNWFPLSHNGIHNNIKYGQWGDISLGDTTVGAKSPTVVASLTRYNGLRFQKILKTRMVVGPTPYPSKMSIILPPPNVSYALEKSMKIWKSVFRCACATCICSFASMVAVAVLLSALKSCK
jgi:hypothetical protein